MLVFWVIAALLIVAALLFLLPPLLGRGRDEDPIKRDELNVTIFRDQIAELDRDLAAGLLTQAQYDVARHDLERNFVQDNKAGESGGATPTDRIVGRATAVVLAIVVPVVSVALYTLLGSGAAGLHPEQAQTEQENITAQADTPKQSLQDAVNSLRARLETEPDNVENWVMLGRSYYFLENFDEASKALERASTLLNNDNPDILADYADALAMAHDRNMLGKPYELVQKALTLQPFHEKSLWLAGVAAFQAQDPQTTLKYWERLLQIFPAGSAEYQQMLSNVNEIKQNLGLPVSPAAPATTPSTTPSSPPAMAQAPAAVSGTVQVSEALRDKVSPTDTVFIFARAVSGPRMPLAILRLQAKDLPLQFTLDDSQAMNPALQLSSVDQAVIGARVSKSGNALPQSGDLQGSVGPIDVRAGQPITIHIDSVVP